MTHSSHGLGKGLLPASLLALSLTVGIGLPAAAQTAATTTDVTPDFCSNTFMSLDLDANGSLTEAEAPQVYARGRIDGATIPDTGLTRDEYLNNCLHNAYLRPTPEAGAPLEGANSFTEAQARDRALAWGLSDVQALTQDDKGIWRGSAKLDGKDVSLAVDFKGNVVTTAP